MPTVLRVEAYRLFFFSLEGNEPPHIHVEKAEAYAKFWLEPVTLARSRGFRSRDLGKVHGIIEKHRDLLLEKWDEHFSN